MDTLIARQDGRLVRAERGIDKAMPFFCPGCMQEVYAATEGKIQRPHFRHKSLSLGNKKGCGQPEHYIHWITKELFADHYREADSFRIEIPVTLRCEQSGICRTEFTHTVDLKKTYPHVLVEAYDQSFKPDCMLYNDAGEVLYLEVKYTHAVSRDKIKSGVPIIEISASSEKVIDEIIADGSIKIDGATHKIYNESALIPTRSTFDCKGKCSPKPIHRPQPVVPRPYKPKVSRASDEKPYWRAIYAGLAEWKSGLSKRERIVKDESAEKTERPDYRSRQYKDD